ncbi:MAG: hypothetical protein R3F62_09700 [Planctomycetota bacterium]
MRLTILCLLALSAVCAQEPDAFEVPREALKGVQRESARLAWRPEVGATRRVRAGSQLVLTQTSEHAHEGEAPAPPILIENTQELTLEVAAVGSEHVDVRCTTGKLAISIGGLGPEQHLDTEQGLRSGNPGLDLFGELVGEPYLLRLEPRGQVLRIQDADDLYRRLREKTQGGFEDLNLETTLDPVRTARELQPLFVEFPEEEELKPGQRWAVGRTVEVAAGESLEGAATYVYLGIAEHQGRKCAKLAARFVFRAQDYPNPGPNGVSKLSGAGEPYALWVDLGDGGVLACETQRLLV